MNKDYVQSDLKIVVGNIENLTSLRVFRVVLKTAAIGLSGLKTIIPITPC